MSEALKDMIKLLEDFLSDKEYREFPLLKNALTICKGAKKKVENLPGECEFKDHCREHAEDFDEYDPEPLGDESHD